MKKPKKRKPTDTTLRNNRARSKEIAELKKRIEAVEKIIFGGTIAVYKYVGKK